MRALIRQMLLCGVAVLIAVPPISAQETNLTGSVRTEAGVALRGASIIVGALNVGALSNAQGQYLLILPSGPTVVDVTASFIGRASQTQAITLQPGTQVLDFVLGEDPLRVAGIVVTALGLERQARTLGVATQQFLGAELTRVEPNIVNSLSGKVAGVHINNSGPQGGSSRIVIRGENSLASNNQPLFIIDGIPIDNSVGGVVGGLTDQGGFDYGNAIQDINPEDIETITVLKGPNAAALYGSRASNGAIIIETKKGRNTPGGAQIVVSQQVTFENELRLPNYQNTYGQGQSGTFSYYDGTGNGVNDEFDESWGPPLDVGLMIPQWYSDYDPLADSRTALPWVSNPNNVSNFFKTGVTSNTNVSVSGSSESVHGRASFSRLNLNGMAPGHTQDRTSLSFAGGIQAVDRLSISASAQYITSQGNNRPGVGYGDDNLMGGFIWFGRQIDTNRLEDRFDDARPADEPNIGGFPYNWNNSFWNNPYFEQLSNTNTDTRDRLIGQVSATYQLNDWLSVLARTGTDWYQDTRLKAYAANPALTLAGSYTTSPVDVGREFINAGGSFGQWNIGFQETNTDFLLNANPDLDLPVTTSFTFGGNRRDFERTNDYTWVGSLTAPGIFDVSNAAEPPVRATVVARKRVNSLYGQAAFGYNNYLFLTVTGRNDWSSTLPEASRSYFYPSVSGSFVVSDVVDGLQSGLVSYAKLRASWAQVGNDTAPYRLTNTLAADEIWEGLTSFSVPGRRENADLKPETTVSYEFGTELGFLDNRLGLDLTYYTQRTRDQVMPSQVSTASGYQSQMINAGVVENKGWEVLVRGTPYSSANFRWESTLTWAKNNSTVVKLSEGVTGLELGLADFWFVSLFAREGEPMGQLVALFDYNYDSYDADGNPDGNIIVDATSGLAGTDFGANFVIGNVNPDWRAGWSNEFSYRGARLSFLFDMRQGGEIFSVTKLFGRYSGVLAETAEGGRCSATGVAQPGYPVCDASNGVVVEGVNEVVTGTDTTYVTNTTVVDQQSYWQNNFTLPRSALEDASYIKLRELTLSFALPNSWTSRLGVDAVDVSVVGRNLFLWTKADHLDPETSFEGTNVQGFEYGQLPTARSFGFNFTVRP